MLQILAFCILWSASFSRGTELRAVRFGAFENLWYQQFIDSELSADKAAETKQWDKAYVLYSDAISKHPNKADLHYKLGAVLAMKASENKWKAIGMLDEIRTSFEKALSLNPKHIESHYALAEYYLQVPGIFGGSVAKAQKYAQKLQAISPVDAHLLVGRIKEYEGKIEEARMAYRIARDNYGSKAAKKKLENLQRRSPN